MKNYKVGDEVLVKGRIEKIDAEDYQRTYRIGFSEDGYSGVSSTCWPDNDNIVESDKTYEDGLKDAWEMARIYSRMEDYERDEMFDGVTNPDYFFDVNHWTPAAAIRRYNEVTVRPGDVVHINDNHCLKNKYVILAINDETVLGYSYCNDEVFRVHNLSPHIKTLQKTGEHVDLSYLTNGGVKENG